MPPKKDIVGKTFGKLTVLDEYEKIPSGTKWKCQCECGKELFVYRGKLTTGHTKSCGCLNETLKGLSGHRLYKTWWSMKERCYSENNCNYPRYGAKGIRICDEWKDDFLVFYNWAITNGYQDNLTIGRIKSDGHYEPSNCQWITLEENVARSNAGKQRRKSKFTYYGVSPEGKEYEFTNASAFAKEHILNENALRRVARGERPHYKQWKFGFTENLNT